MSSASNAGASCPSSTGFLAGKRVVPLGCPDTELLDMIARAGGLVSYGDERATVTIVPNLRYAVTVMHRGDEVYTAQQLRALSEGRSDVIGPSNLYALFDNDDSSLHGVAMRVALELLSTLRGTPPPTDAASARAAACAVMDTLNFENDSLTRLLLTVAAVRVLLHWDREHLLTTLNLLPMHGGCRLLNSFIGDSDPSVWNHDTFDSDAVEVMFPDFCQDDVMIGSPQYTAGERAYTAAYDRTTAAVLAQLWDWTDPSYGFARPAEETLRRSATSVIAALPALLPDAFIRRAARCDAAWELSDGACEYVRNMIATSPFALLADMTGTDEAPDATSDLTLFLLHVRFTRMALRISRGRVMEGRFAFNAVQPCNVTGCEESLHSNCWQFHKWLPLFVQPLYGDATADVSAARVTHPLTLPCFAGTIDGNVMLSIMYLMRYRVYTMELAWQRRAPIASFRRSTLAAAR